MSEESSRWKLWAENPCWEELMQMIAEIIGDSIKDEDSISTKDLTIQSIAEARGIRKGLDTLMARLDQKMNDFATTQKEAGNHNLNGRQK